MKTAVLFLVLFAGNAPNLRQAPVKPAVDQHTMLSVLGYALGESISVHNQTEINDCGNIPRQRTVADVKADKTIRPAIRNIYIDQAKAGKLWTREPTDYHEKCDGLIAAIKDGKRWNKPLSGAFYEGGQLVSFETLIGETNEIVLADAIEKFGKPTRQTTVPYQNGFGAQWVDRISEWELPNGFVQLYESNKPGDGRPVITIETTKEHAREEAERKSKGNSLDHPRS